MTRGAASGSGRRGPAPLPPAVDLNDPRIPPHVGGVARRAIAEQLAAQDAARQIRTLTATPESDAALEKATQKSVTDLFRAFGCVVRSTSQARASKVAPGLPDLLVHHRPRRLFWFWESKRPVGGRLSGAQLEFAADCEATDTLCGSGSRADAEVWLIGLGLAERGPGGVLEPVRPTRGPAFPLPP